MSTRLHNKTALVTGSSQGLGRAIALSFAHHGAHLVVCADLDPDRKSRISLPAKPSEELSIEEIGQMSVTQTTAIDDEHQDSEPSELSKSSLLQINRDADQGDDDDRKATHELICKRYGAGKAVFVECDVTKEEGEEGVKGAVEEAAKRGLWGLNISLVTWLQSFLPDASEDRAMWQTPRCGWAIVQKARM
ncbi:MAG: hypothetical protein Q9167_007465 [Letrouitia subvulpina]